MSVRFRIRTSQGQEVSFASHEMFAEFVRSGDLSPDDVVYDAETREWSSAMTHPVVLEIGAEDERADDHPAEGDPEVADTAEPNAEGSPESATVSEGAAASTAGLNIGLDLAPAPSQLTPEQASEAFVKKMKAERATSFDFDDEQAAQGITMEQGSSGLVRGIVDAPEETAPQPAPPKRRDPSFDKPPPRPREPQAPKRQKSGAGRRYAPLLIVGAVVLAAGVYFGPELLTPGTGQGAEARTDSVTLPPLPPPLIPDTEEALRARAQERYLTTTRALLRDLPPIPSAWLTGSYLAAPSDYPGVREVWNLYLTTVRQVRAGDNERYRAAYLRALEDARVEGSARTLRLAGAVASFQGRVEPRAAHYDRVEALAMAALRGHDALVEAEGTIAYEPATGTPVSGDPVIEAVGRNPDAQALLDQVLDMILAQVDAPNGPGQSANVGEWVWNGLLGAVTTN